MSYSVIVFHLGDTLETVVTGTWAPPGQTVGTEWFRTVVECHRTGNMERVRTRITGAGERSGMLMEMRWSKCGTCPQRRLEMLRGKICDIQARWTRLGMVRGPSISLRG